MIQLHSLCTARSDIRLRSVICSLAVASIIGTTACVRRAFGEESGGQPEVRLNKFIALLEAEEPAFGIFSYGRSMRNAVAVSDSEVDFVIVDMEHGALDLESLQRFFLAMVNARRVIQKGNVQPDVVPMVRLPQNGRERLQFFIKQALDLGAYGIMLPHIETAQEALAAVRASRYAHAADAPDAEPVGQRGVSYGFAARVWGIDAERYQSVADLWPLDRRGEIVLIHQIESVRGVENAKEIMQVPGVGAVFIGPADLAMSMGVSRKHPSVERQMRRVLQIALDLGIPCGAPGRPETVKRRLEQGYAFVTIGNDLGLSASASATLRAAGRKPQP